MDATGQDIMCVIALENLRKAFWVGKRQLWALVVNEAALEVKQEGVFWNMNRIAVLIGAVR